MADCCANCGAKQPHKIMGYNLRLEDGSILWFCRASCKWDYIKQHEIKVD